MSSSSLCVLTTKHSISNLLLPLANRKLKVSDALRFVNLCIESHNDVALLERLSMYLKVFKHSNFAARLLVVSVKLQPTQGFIVKHFHMLNLGVKLIDRDCFTLCIFPLPDRGGIFVLNSKAPLTLVDDASYLAKQKLVRLV